MSRGVSDYTVPVSLPSFSVAAHELKSPLALMRQLSLLLNDETLSSAERQSYQSQLITVADRALKLTTDLSQIANLQSPLFPLEPVNPFAVCRSMAYDMAELASVYDRRVEWPRPRRKQLLVVANSNLLKRVVSNFVDNALKYTDEGLPVRVSVSKISGVVRIGVRDFGPYMSKREHKRLLSELDTLKTVKTRPDSSGLGVFLASQFAKSMGGEVGLIRHREGLTFFVDLPESTQTSFL